MAVSFPAGQSNFGDSPNGPRILAPRKSSFGENRWPEDLGAGDQICGWLHFQAVLNLVSNVRLSSHLDFEDGTTFGSLKKF